MIWITFLTGILDGSLSLECKCPLIFDCLQGSIIPQWGLIFLRRGSIILQRGSVKQVFLVWGLCTTKLRSICKRTGCLWRKNCTCWLSRLVKLRWNTTEIRRTYRPKSWKILTKPFIWSVRNKMWKLWEVNVVKYKNTLTHLEHVQFQTEARVYLFNSKQKLASIWVKPRKCSFVIVDHR